jgi:hypothetical protein
VGLNLSGLRIARELGMDQSDARDTITMHRQGIVNTDAPQLGFRNTRARGQALPDSLSAQLAASSRNPS